MSRLSRNGIFCLAFLLLMASYMPLASGQGSVSGIFAQARSLANIIGRGVGNNPQTWAEVLQMLDRTGASQEMGDRFRKLVGKALDEGSGTLPEHLERIESAVRALEPGIDEVVARLNGEQRPNLGVGDLADENSRCNTIDVLRDDLRQMGKDVEALKALPVLLDKAEKHVDILDRLSRAMADGYEEMFDEISERFEGGNISVLPEIIFIGFFRSELETVILQLLVHNPDQIRTIGNVISRLRRKLNSVPSNIDALKSNYDANMTAWINPLARDSGCEDGLDEEEDGLDEDLDRALNEVDEAADEDWTRLSGKKFSGDAFQQAMQHFNDAMQHSNRQSMTQAMQAMNSGLQAWNQAMQQGLGPAGNDQRCGQARAQVRAYDDGLRQIDPGHSRQHAQAHSLYTQGRKANQKWIKANC